MPSQQDRHSSAQAGRRCQGCGVDLPPKTWKGRDRKWCSDRCRKQTLYSGRCVDCGAPTNGSDGLAKAPQRCLECSQRLRHEERRWTKETIVAAILRWADEHGKPPAATDWNAPMARRYGRPERGWEYPAVATVQAEFGSWSAALEAAGLRSRLRYQGDDPALSQKAGELYASGLSSTAVAAELGIDKTTVINAARAAGVPIRGRWSYAA